MRAARKSQRAATLASALALGAGALALVPSASLAATHSCGNHTYLLVIPTGSETPPEKLKLPIKQIKAKGVSCTAAIKFIGKLYKSTNGGVPEGYKCTSGHFSVPKGTVPESCTKGGKKITFAGRGG